MLILHQTKFIDILQSNLAFVAECHSILQHRFNTFGPFTYLVKTELYFFRCYLSHLYISCIDIDIGRPVAQASWLGVNRVNSRNGSTMMTAL